MTSSDEKQNGSVKDDRLEIVKLEERIAPLTGLNHNETLAQGNCFEMARLEERIAPLIGVNHNETLVRG
jgi:hypothetical protein